jgi:hypothetical protein
MVLAQEPVASGVYALTRNEQSAGVLPVKDVEIHGSNNANSMYNAVVHYSGTPCGSAVLQLDGALIGSNGSSDFRGCGLWSNTPA